MGLSIPITIWVEEREHGGGRYFRAWAKSIGSESGHSNQGFYQEEARIRRWEVLLRIRSTYVTYNV